MIEVRHLYFYNSLFLEIKILIVLAYYLEVMESDFLLQINIVCILGFVEDR